MNIQRIDQLIRKYEQGNSSLEEEKELKSFFSRNDVPREYRIYRDLFGFYEASVNEELPDRDFDEKFFGKIGQKVNSVAAPKIRRLYSFVAIAATIIILAGIYFVFQNQKKTSGTYDDPKLAYAEARKVLFAVSTNLNSGMKELSNVKEINSGMQDLEHIKAFDQGLKDMEKISLLDKSKKQITQ